jgi:hypothetical protein
VHTCNTAHVAGKHVRPRRVKAGSPCRHSGQTNTNRQTEIRTCGSAHRSTRQSEEHGFSHRALPRHTSCPAHQTKSQFSVSLSLSLSSTSSSHALFPANTDACATHMQHAEQSHRSHRGTVQRTSTPVLCPHVNRHHGSKHMAEGTDRSFLDTAVVACRQHVWLWRPLAGGRIEALDTL